MARVTARARRLRGAAPRRFRFVGSSVRRFVVVKSHRRSVEVEGMGNSRRTWALATAVMLLAGACSSTPAASGGPVASSGGGLTKVRFQLQWVAQAQFAGYYAAIDQGYYKDQGLDVSLLLGGPDINPMQ